MKIGQQGVCKIGKGRVPDLSCMTINSPEIQREWKLTLGAPKPTTLIFIVDGRWSLRDMPDRVAVAAPVNNTQKDVIEVELCIGVISSHLESGPQLQPWLHWWRRLTPARLSWHSPLTCSGFMKNRIYKVKDSMREHAHSLFHGVEETRMNGSVRRSTRKKIGGQWSKFEVEIVQDREPDRHMSISQYRDRRVASRRQTSIATYRFLSLVPSWATMIEPSDGA
jgi:hypothetical protein